MNAAENPKAEFEDLASRPYFHLIGDRLVKSPETFDVINPATGKVFAKAPECTKEQCDETVSVAKKAFQTWSRSTHEERKQLIEAIVSKTNENKDMLVNLLGKIEDSVPFRCSLLHAEVFIQLIYLEEIHEAAVRAYRLS